VEQLDRTVREIRTSIFDLHTAGPDRPAGLRRRLLDVVADLTGDTTVSPSMRISGAVDTVVLPHLGDHAEAVVREALSNALRHSGGDDISVAVDAEADRLVVEVADNGVGIPPRTERSGLDNIVRRARQCGGDATIGDRPGGGTRVRWWVPLR
jgi:signal transduction histidine kinase